MVLNEDVEANFRRNLLVYCTVILVGNFLHLPLENLAKRLLDIEATQLNPIRIFAVQCFVLAYLIHRHYFSKSGRLILTDLKDRQKKVQDGLVKRFAERLMSRSNQVKQPWPETVIDSQQKLFSTYQKNSSVKHPSPEQRYDNFQLSFATNVHDWIVVANVYVDARCDPKVPLTNEDAPPLNIGQTNIVLPSRLRLPIRVWSWIEAIFFSNEATEHVFLFLLTFATVIALIGKYFQIT